MSPAALAPVCVDDHETHARKMLDPNAWAHFAGGAADERTPRVNREAWNALWLQPRVLRPLAQGHTRAELFGRTLAHPLLLAPVAFQRLAHPHGEPGSALAAAAQGAGLVLSTQSSTLLEAVARAVRDDAQREPLWFQLYLQDDRGFDLARVRRAEAAGFEALVLTVDAPVHGARDRERRAGCRPTCRRSACTARHCRRAAANFAAGCCRPRRRGTTSPGCDA